MKRECLVCQKSFTVLAHIGEKHRFCSKECNQESYRLARRATYETVATRTCLLCTKEFKADVRRVRGTLSQKFCSDGCARQHHNAGRRKGPAWDKQMHLRRESAEHFAASMESTKAAYFAGLIDGEGFIGTQISDNRHAGGLAFTERIRVTVAMTHEQTVTLFHDVFGGSLRREDRRKKNWKDAYYCELNGWRAYACLMAVFPYLITKREQAHLAIEFQRIRKTVAGSRIEWHPHVAAQRGEYHKALRKLNRRGR